MTVVPDPFQVRVAQVALSIAQRYGFALGGGHAWRWVGLRLPTGTKGGGGGWRRARRLRRPALRQRPAGGSQPPASHR